MTQEEKAKAYDRALEIAKAWCKLDNNDLCNDDLETLFPELKESEDERIRKELIKFVKVNVPDEERYIAWLEKQGEKDKLIEDKDKLIKELGEYKVKYTQEVISQQLENQVGQKPTDKAKPKFKVGDWVVITTTKEDRAVQIASVQYFTKDGYPSYITTEGRWFGKGTKARLLTDKDVKSITIPESKAIVNKIKSWSEEDEKKRKCLIKGLEDRMGFGWASDPFSREEYINWLKSLRTQSQWKPSDEQMAALRGVCYAGQRQELINLYNDLKKLMEENYDKNV